MRPTEVCHASITPIWLAALVATGCQVIADGDRRDVGWEFASGSATYTNAGSNPVRIDPFGVKLAGGETLSVTWVPGETEYTLRIDSPRVMHG